MDLYRLVLKPQIRHEYRDLFFPVFLTVPAVSLKEQICLRVLFLQFLFKLPDASCFTGVILRIAVMRRFSRFDLSPGKE